MAEISSFSNIVNLHAFSGAEDVFTKERPAGSSAVPKLSDEKFEALVAQFKQALTAETSGERMAAAEKLKRRAEFGHARYLQGINIIQSTSEGGEIEQSAFFKSIVDSLAIRSDAPSISDPLGDGAAGALEGITPVINKLLEMERPQIVRSMLEGDKFSLTEEQLTAIYGEDYKETAPKEVLGKINIMDLLAAIANGGVDV